MLDKALKNNGNLEIIDGGVAKPAVWKVDPSTTAKNCRNLIREIVDTLDLQPNPEKPVIPLSLGDPTVYGNLPPSAESVQAIVDVVQEGHCNGYVPSVGIQQARAAVAEYVKQINGVEAEPKDIILCSGCSSALEHCITALADAAKNHNIVVPRPGFPIYRTLAETIGVTVKYYNLIPENSYEADLDHLDAQIDSNTAAIVINNPSNPCGSVYSEEHLRNLLEVAHRHQVPVIADEVYEQMVFGGKKFVSTASLHSGVPILVCSGLAKRFLVPGWRMGWIIVHDEIGAFEHIRKSLAVLSQRTIGSNTIVQGALPAILRNTPQSFFDDVLEKLYYHAQIAFCELGKAKGLTPHMPEGALYMFVEIQLNRFPEFNTGLEMVQKMMEEESVFCLPGECFETPGFMRIVLSLPSCMMKEACQRIIEFCNRHYVKN